MGRLERSTRHGKAAAASTLLSAPVLGSAMGRRRSASLAKVAVSRTVEAGFGDEATTVRTLIWRSDRWLSRNHRNDFVYRRAVVTQMPTWAGAVLLPEYRAGRSKIDILAVSHELHAAEIKSDLDNTSRLLTQLSDYRRVAPLVSLVASRRIVERLWGEAAFDRVGLYWLDDDGDMRTMRPAVHDDACLDSETMMRSLRRTEYLAVLARLGWSIGDDVPNTRIFGSALEASRAVPPLDFHREVASQLQGRALRAGRSAISRLPAPVRPAVLALDPSRCELARLRDWLDLEVVDVHA